MRKTVFLLTSLLVIYALGAGCLQESPPSSIGLSGPSAHVKSVSSLQDLDAIHLNMSALDIPRMRATVVDRQVDMDIRNRAIFVLTDIALSTNRTEEALTFLKTVALTETDAQLRNAAYANIDLIRHSVVTGKYGDFEVRIEGAIHQGANVTLVATVTPSVATSKTLFGISKIVEREEGLSDGIVLINPPVWPMLVNVQPGSSKEIPITLSLAREGEYQIVCILQMDIDRIDYQRIQKEVYITVRKDSGEYEVVETPQSFSS